MNLVRISPGTDLELGRPPTLEEVAGQDGLLVFPRADDIRAGMLDSNETAAHWRQVAFHSEQVSRLYGPQDPDPRRNMTPEMAVMHRDELMRHMGALGLIETPQPQPDISAPELLVAA